MKTILLILFTILMQAPAYAIIDTVELAHVADIQRIGRNPKSLLRQVIFELPCGAIFKKFIFSDIQGSPYKHALLGVLIQIPDAMCEAAPQMASKVFTVPKAFSDYPLVPLKTFEF